MSTGYPPDSLRYPQDIPKISPKISQDIPNIPPRYPQETQKLSPRYPQDGGLVLICGRINQPTIKSRRCLKNTHSQTHTHKPFATMEIQKYHNIDGRTDGLT